MQFAVRGCEFLNGMRNRKVTGWVGIVESTKYSLMNEVHPSDHLESLLFLADY